MKMKTVISVLLSLLLAFTLLPVSAFAAPQDALMLIFGIEVAPYENGSVEVSSERGSTGSDITITAVADEGYAVESVSVAGESGAECELTENEGVYSFKMPSEAVVVTVVFAAAGETEPEVPVLELPFEDVAVTDQYYDEICYVYEAQLMNGINGTLFAPNNYMTRTMAATVLARIDGIDTAAGEDWTAAGLEWAIANGITDGSGMEDPITREQLLVMLYRYAALKGIDVTVDTVIPVPGVSDWAAEAVSWVIANGYISAEAAELIDVSAPATRGEAAMLFARLGAMLEAIEVPPVEEIPEETEETEAVEETEVVEETEAVEETTEAVETAADAE